MTEGAFKRVGSSIFRTGLRELGNEGCVRLDKPRQPHCLRFRVLQLISCAVEFLHAKEYVASIGLVQDIFRALVDFAIPHRAARNSTLYVNCLAQSGVLAFPSAPFGKLSVPGDSRHPRIRARENRRRPKDLIMPLKRVLLQLCNRKKMCHSRRTFDFSQTSSAFARRTQTSELP
jgi:hypothetical protein